MTEPIMIFKVYADPEDCSDMMCSYGEVSFIPFTATVESELFCGKTLPGACDVQVENPAGSRNMCAKYMFKGTDSEGKYVSMEMLKVGKITKKEIMELCPDISKVTVERTLTELVKSEYIAKVGSGSSTAYVRIWYMMS